MTKKEAQEAKRQFLLSLNQNINHKDMTFKDLYLSFYDYQSDKVKEDTIKTYRDKVKYFQYFINIKLKDFNINHLQGAYRKSIVLAAMPATRRARPSDFTLLRCQ